LWVILLGLTIAIPFRLFWRTDILGQATVFFSAHLIHHDLRRDSTYCYQKRNHDPYSLLKITFGGKIQDVQPKYRISWRIEKDLKGFQTIVEKLSD